MSDQHVNKIFNRQGFKAQVNNVFLKLRISAVSCERNSTTELKFDVNVCRELQLEPELGENRGIVNR